MQWSQNEIYIPEREQFTTIDGRSFTDRDFDGITPISSGGSGDTYRAGSHTKKKAAFFNTFLRKQGEGLSAKQQSEMRKRLLDSFSDKLSRNGLGLSYRHENI